MKKQFLIILVFAIVCNLITDFYAGIFSVEVNGSGISVFIYHMLWAVQGAGWMIIRDWVNNDKN